MEYTNKGGSTNLVRNPLLTIINELDRDSLQYWRDLGLTPAGFKKVNEKSTTIKKQTSLSEILADL